MGTEQSSAADLARDELADKRTKKALIVDVIKEKAASSGHEILQKIDRAINNLSGDDGDGSFELKVKYISGGRTNYYYEVFVDKHPEKLRVFAKLCFDRSSWNPAAPAAVDDWVDLQKTENAHMVMGAISRRAPDCVVSPLACWDVVDNTHGSSSSSGQRKMKLLVTEWSEADEQFSNQFMDGAVDPRIAPKIANTLASLHDIKDFDSSYNVLIKPWMENILMQLIHLKNVALLASQKTDNPVRRTDAYCASLGEELVMKIVNANIADHLERDCLIHGDAHVFNILVEKKPSIQELESFGPKGKMVICDWEMAMVGPRGKDVGLALAFPIGCMIAHALNGHPEANESIDDYVNALLDTYCFRMVSAGKTPGEMSTIIRRIAGWCGWLQYFAFYVLDAFPFPVDSEASKTRLRDALGVLGFKLLRLSYDSDYVASSACAGDVRRIFDALREEEVERARVVFASGKRRRRPRKSSIFRAADRRVSDGEMFYLAAESVKRISVSSDITESVRDSVRRLSAAADMGDSFRGAMKRLSSTKDIRDSLREINRFSLGSDREGSLRELASPTAVKGIGESLRGDPIPEKDTFEKVEHHEPPKSVDHRCSLSDYEVPGLKTRPSLFSSQHRGLGLS